MPISAGWIDAGVRSGGGQIASPSEASAAIWTQPDDLTGLRGLLAANDHLEWIQLPWAGVEPYLSVMDKGRVWTCAKGVYAEPVAEHALALTLAGLRNLHSYSRAKAWSAGVGRNLIGANVVIYGGGGIAQALIRLLAPFNCRVTVVRRHPTQMEGVERVMSADEHHDALTGADVVVLALPLLDDNTGLIGPRELALMPEHCWLVNVARGAHVQTPALLEALNSGSVGGAALDVTDPEPLGDDHPMWSMENVIITPHTANTKEMARPLLGARITENVRRFAAGEELIGLVDLELGY